MYLITRDDSHSCSAELICRPHFGLNFLEPGCHILVSKWKNAFKICCKCVLGGQEKKSVAHLQLVWQLILLLLA